MPGASRFGARRILMYVEDLPAAQRFYQEVLGFTPLRGVPGVNLELDTGGGPPLVLHQGGAGLPEPGGLKGAVPSFQVDDLQAVAAELAQSGVRTIYGPREVPHGWIYFFADGEDNVVQLYQPKERPD